MRKISFFHCVILIICYWFLFVLSAHAQESDPQQMLFDSVGQRDVAGVKLALAKGANPNWIYDIELKSR